MRGEARGYWTALVERWGQPTRPETVGDDDWALVLAFCAEGRTYADLARSRGWSRERVRGHVLRALRRTNMAHAAAHRRAEPAVWSMSEAEMARQIAARRRQEVER